MNNPPPATNAVAGPRALLRGRDAVAIIVGIVIGAGIFRTPPLVAGTTGDPGWMILAWIAGGVVSLIGALCYAELACAYPHTGGDYHFLTRAYGRNVSFLYAWARATVINTGSIALLAFVFGDYLSRLVPLGAYSSAIWAAVVVIVLTTINLQSLTASARTQNWLTVLEVSGLLLVVVAGAFATPAAGATTPAWFSSTPAAGMLGLAMVFVLLTYGGWNEAAYLSAELRGGHRAIVWTLVASIAIITLLYVATNVSLLQGLGFSALGQSKAAPADLMTSAFGGVAGGLLAGFVALATLTSINATMLVGARTNFALSGDWASLKLLGGWNAARGVPTRAFLLQSAIALALVAFGAAQKDGFEAMVEFTAPVFWGFLTLVGIAVFVLRRRDPAAARPFRVPLYPLTPAIFIAACGWLFYSSVGYAISRSAIHVCIAVMVVGLIALVIIRTRPGKAH